MIAPDIFKSAAYYYARYRSFYPDQEIKDIVKIFRLTKKDRVLDIGSGTGQLAIQLAPHVREIVAIEPDGDMIREGKKLARKYQVKNIHWMLSRAEDLDKIDQLGIFKLITFGASFHWLDQRLVLKSVRSLIGRGGGIVVAGAPTIWNSVEPWEERIKQVIQKYLGEKRRAGSGTFQGLLKKGDSYEKVIAKAGFKQQREKFYSRVNTKSIDEIVGNVFSTSYANPMIFGRKKEAFERELRRMLIKINPLGKSQKQEKYFAIFAKRG